MITELSYLLKSSIERCLEDEVSISFSGGLDSSLIAHIGNKYSAVSLFSSGIENSEDLNYSEIISKELNLPLNKIILSEDSILDLYSEIYKIIPTSFIKIGILLPIYSSIKRAKEMGFEVMLFGSGAEELFIGYKRYFDYLDSGKNLDSIVKREFRTLPKKERDVGMLSKISRKLGVEPRFPFMDYELSQYVFSISIERRAEDRDLKKKLLREASKLLSLTPTALNRKKKASQYGSGVQKILIKNSDYLNENYPEHKIDKSI